MRLTRYSDYALRVLIYLALRGERLSTIREIADAYGISRTHLMKIVASLTRMGYIEAVRGNQGGIRLRRPPESINVGEVVRLTEEDPDLAECFRGDNRCVITPVCRLKNILGDALEAFLGVLDTHTLADLLWDADRAATLLRIDPPGSSRRP